MDKPLSWIHSHIFSCHALYPAMYKNTLGDREHDMKIFDYGSSFSHDHIFLLNNTLSYYMHVAYHKLQEFPDTILTVISRHPSYKDRLSGIYTCSNYSSEVVQLSAATVTIPAGAPSF